MRVTGLTLTHTRRLAKTSAACPASFRRGSSWVLTKDSRVRQHSCHTHPVLSPGDTIPSSKAHDFWREARTMQDAIARYGIFHDSVTSAVDLRGDERYLIYTPSFHGEGWGNRVMALAAVGALAMSTGEHTHALIFCV